MDSLTCDDQFLQPGDKYRISVAKQAVFLAHSSLKIPKDPTTNPRFDGYERRFLWRVGDHPLRRIFERQLCDDIMHHCTSSSLRWDSVGLYRQGYHANDMENPLTILMSVSEKPDERTYNMAETLAHQVEYLLRQNHFYDVHVEIITYPYAKEGVGEARSCLETIEDYGFTMSNPIVFHPVFNGSSIGPENQKGSGTLSCYIALRKGEQSRICGLTCHHVASIGQKNMLAPLLAENSVRMLSPSETDARKTFGHLEEAIESLKTIVARQDKEKQEREWIGKEWTNALEAGLARQKKELQEVTTALTSLQTSWEEHRFLGQVWRSSGLTDPQPGHSLKDWALIDLDLNRFHDLPNIQPDFLDLCKAVGAARNICNKLHIDCPTDADRRFLRFFTPGREEVVPVQEIRMMATAKKPTYVFLHGRSTTFSVGVLHDVRDGICTRYVSGNGQEREFISREVVVLDVPSGHPECDAPVVTVSKGGDSGAALRLADRRIIGFIFGRNISDQSGRPATYVSLAEHLLSHIKETMGADEVMVQGVRRELDLDSPRWIE